MPSAAGSRLSLSGRMGVGLARISMHHHHRRGSGAAAGAAGAGDTLNTLNTLSLPPPPASLRNHAYPPQSALSRATMLPRNGNAGHPHPHPPPTTDAPAPGPGDTTALPTDPDNSTPVPTNSIPIPTPIPPPISASDPGGGSALERAARSGHAEIVRLILYRDASSSSTSPPPPPPALLGRINALTLASLHGHLDVVKLLAGAPTATTGELSPPPLLSATIYTAALLGAGRLSPRCTPLYAAAARGRTDVVEYLLRADPRSAAALHLVPGEGADPDPRVREVVDRAVAAGMKVCSDVKDASGAGDTSPDLGGVKVPAGPAPRRSGSTSLPRSSSVDIKGTGASNGNGIGIGIGKGRGSGGGGGKGPGAGSLRRSIAVSSAARAAAASHRKGSLDGNGKAS
ncbi:hypothetical protein DFH27DRAFT_579206 [Peziza echinospora]|nr:hypothetical protein DFH27DRAFT_579206 [Peziza echinospora]